MHEPCDLDHGSTRGGHPSFAEVRGRFLRNFTGLHVPKAERLEALDFEVLLTPRTIASTTEEIAEGWLARVSAEVSRKASSGLPLPRTVSAPSSEAQVRVEGQVTVSGVDEMLVAG